jgi:hypothetical protein
MKKTVDPPLFTQKLWRTLILVKNLSFDEEPDLFYFLESLIGSDGT